MASSKDNVRLGGFKAYFGTQYLGECSADGVTISRNGNAIDVMTALTGAGIFKTFSSGETAEISLELEEFDKYVLGQILGAVKTWNTSSSDATAGTLAAGYSPGVEAPAKPLYIYPTFVDSSNVPFPADNTNKFCFGFVLASPTMENEFTISPTEETKFPITFKALTDTSRAEGQRVWFCGAVTNPANSVPTISS